MTLRIRMPALAGAFVAALLASTPAAALQIATFDDLGLGVEDEYHGEDSAGGFASGGIHFSNDYDTTFGSWDGFAASSITDDTTPGFGNQFSALPGGGADASAAYGVGFWSSFALENPTVSFDVQSTAVGMYITNSTYAGLSMRDGDPFAKQFGGPTGDDPDWFLLTIEGFDDLGVSTGTIEFYLADYRFADNSLDYIVDEWEWVELTGLGEISSLEFSLSSSDVGQFGMNTPSYFALDSVTIVPEPAAASLVALAAGALAGLRRKRVE